MICARRGLDVRASAVKLAMKELSRGGYSRQAVVEWLDTPAAYGGGGWGIRGRMSLSWIGGEIRESLVKLKSENGIYKDVRNNCAKVNADRWKGAVDGLTLTRLGMSVPLPTKRSIPVLKRLKLESRSLKIPMLGRSSIPYRWRPEDKYDLMRQKVNPWAMKLSVEAWFEGRIRLEDRMVKSALVRSSPLGAGKALRILKKFEGETLNLGTSVSSGEPGYRIADNFKASWMSVVSYFVINNSIRYESSEPKVNILETALATLRGMCWQFSRCPTGWARRVAA
jgi:hypothetical protein